MKVKVIMLMLGILLVGCEKEVKEIIRPVETVTISSLPKELYYEYPGVVSSGNESILAFKVAGPIKKMNVEIGSFVKKDEIIAEMDTRDYEVQLKAFENKSKVAKNAYEASKAVAENAKKQFERVETLYKEKAIPKKSYDDALAGLKSATAGELAMFSQYQEALQGVENCKNQLKDTKLKAPYDGYINKKFADEGSVVAGGIPVVAISSVDKKQVKISVSERDIKGIEKGKGEFIIDNKHYPLKVEEIGKVKNIGKMTYPVTFNFEGEEPQLLVDSVGIVRVACDTNQREEVIVPIEAVFERDGKTRVWIYKDGKVLSKEIVIVAPYNNGKVIIDGVTIGEKIVTKGVHELSEEQRVKELQPFTDTNVGKVL